MRHESSARTTHTSEDQKIRRFMIPEKGQKKLLISALAFGQIDVIATISRWF
jgi:hypothetical protein